MPGRPPDGSDFLGEIRDMKKRLRKLEAKNRSKTEFFDIESGQNETGRIWKDGDLNLNLVQTDVDRGMVYPHDHTQWIVPVSQSITTATWTTIAEVEIQIPNGDVFQWTAALIASVGTTVGVRIRDVINGTFYGTQTQAGAVNSVTCEWLHPFTVGWGTSGENDTGSPAGSTAFLQYQVQNTNAVGTVFAFTPRSLMIRNRRFTNNESLNTPFTFS